MAEKNEGREESNPEWNKIYNRRADQQMADDSDEQKKSNTEWKTLYNRSSEQHDPIEHGVDARHTQIVSRCVGGISTSTKCVETQTDINLFSKENLDLVADEMARAVHECIHSDGEFRRVIEDKRLGDHYVSFIRKIFDSTETQTVADITSSLVNDADLNYILHDHGINIAECGEGLSELIKRYEDQLYNNAEMVSNGPDQFCMQAAVNDKLMAGLMQRTRNNQCATVAVKKSSVIPRQPHSRYTQTEPSTQYDTSEESLKAIGRRLGVRTVHSLTKRKDTNELSSEDWSLENLCSSSLGDAIEADEDELSSEDWFLEMLFSSSLGDVMGFDTTCCSKLLTYNMHCDEPWTQGDSDSIDKHRSSSEVDIEKTSTTEGTRNQYEIPEALTTIADEIAQVLEFYTDADHVSLMNMRHLPGCDQHNEKLITLMGISPTDCSVMEIDVDKNKTYSENEQNNKDMPTTCTLSTLIRGHLDKRKLRDDHYNTNKVSEMNFLQPTLEEHQKYKSVSLATSVVMSCIGYGPNMRKQRIDWYRKFGRRFTAVIFGCVSALIVGSKAEGLTRFFESDWDFICVLNHLICIENDNDVNSIDKNITVLVMETDASCPGYCRLVLKRYISSFVLCLSRAFLKDETGRLFLSSDEFLKLTGGWFLGVPGLKPLPRAGPSLPSLKKNVHFDRVVALRCHCPSILNRWAERARHWPPPDIVHKVVSLEAFAAPVGFKESKSHRLQWRICFNTAETELIINLNDTQTKLYVLLKMVVKDVLRPRRKEITSYTVKNIVLWLAEKNQQALFHNQSLLLWLHKGLEELRTAIASKNLEYYMIPERNLMAASGLENGQQRVWVDTLTAMMGEGPMVILRFQKIRQAIISYPEPLFWYSKIRTELEMLMFFMMKCFASLLEFKPLTDSTLGEIISRLLEIIEEVHKRLNKEGIWFYDIWDVLVRMMS